MKHSLNKKILFTALLASLLLTSACGSLMSGRGGRAASDESLIYRESTAQSESLSADNVVSSQSDADSGRRASGSDETSVSSVSSVLLTVSCPEEEYIKDDADALTTDPETLQVILERVSAESVTEYADFTADEYIEAARTVYRMAHDNGFTYGNS